MKTRPSLALAASNYTFSCMAPLCSYLRTEQMLVIGKRKSDGIKKKKKKKCRCQHSSRYFWTITEGSPAKITMQHRQKKNTGAGDVTL